MPPPGLSSQELPERELTHWAEGLLCRELGDGDDVAGLGVQGADGDVAGLGVQGADGVVAGHGVQGADGVVAGLGVQGADGDAVTGGAETSTVLLSLLLEGSSLQNSAEVWSRPSHLQRDSTSVLLLASMATSSMVMTALCSSTLEGEGAALLVLCADWHFELSQGLSRLCPLAPWILYAYLFVRALRPDTRATKTFCF